ncbi:MAG: double-strand break repair helicase AddA [Roseomonas sp.]|nr:double-strand break repair helicase AddA [Roseomonas sp.]
MSEARQRAEAAQASAADPKASAWVEASAGSGKTKLLTDRLLRLLLAGVPPGRILCLTFTKAAAAEMATRLALRLGEWAVADDATLVQMLRKLTGATPGREGLAAARRLFVEVLEQPGGMRISTLHGFAQSLLRGFPLEAGLAPQFAVMQERDGRALLVRERDALLVGGAAQDALAVLAKYQAPTRFAEVINTMAGASSKFLGAEEKRQGMAGLRAALMRKLGIPLGEDDEATIIAAVIDAPEAEALRAAAPLLLAGGKQDIGHGEKLAAWFALPEDQRIARHADWRAIFMTTDNDVRSKLATQKLGARQADISDLMRREGERQLELDGKRAAARVLAASMALFAIGAPVLRRYQAAKENAGLLDYDDLIAGARKLLDNPGSAWVLYKLDDGLDHILLDEAQDSNPEQWGIVRALAAEFFAGLGARDEERSIFAVGDQKQSIYAFQGADAEGFVREKSHYDRVVKAAGGEFRAVPLDVSFRSTQPVLALVDAVFAEAPARDGVAADKKLEHRVDRAGHAGNVELWPILQVDKAPPPPDWAPPEQAVAAEGAAPALAAALAQRIRWMMEHETLPARVERGEEAAQPKGRPIRPGDILVLLRARKRGGFAAALVRELKKLSIPVGGIDRMVLADELAVQDMLALAASLLLPDDDLNLAALLKSPLIGLDEDALFELAHGRGTSSLHAALMAHRGSASALGRIADWLAAQAAQLDFITPYGLFADVLGGPGPLDPRAGRARMLARLGPDAGDPLDELLNAALEHEKLNPPSLQGFVHWLRQGGAEVKREAEAAGDVVRIMTVHGSKGLQAPIVILPDTTGKAQDRKTLRWFEDGSEALPVWAPQVKGFEAPALTAQRQADQAREAEEEHRLLYVALTRAEDRLIICGWNGAKKLPEGCWYDLVAQGFARLAGHEATGFDPADFGAAVDGFGTEPKLLSLNAPQTAPPRLEDPMRAGAAEARPPAWAWQKLAEEAPAGSLAPSALPGEQETPAAAPRPAQDPLGLRFRRGRLVHALLQSLPEHPASLWEELTRRFLTRRAPGLSTAEQEATLQEVLDLLRQGWMREALGAGSLAEAPLAGEVNGRLIAGQVDRLKIEAGRVLVLDYKTNRPPPENVDQVAPLYLRQMAAYRALLRAAFPGRVVECALVWTYGARFMALPDAALDPHAPGEG